MFSPCCQPQLSLDPVKDIDEQRHRWSQSTEARSELGYTLFAYSMNTVWAVFFLRFKTPRIFGCLKNAQHTNYRSFRDREIIEPRTSCLPDKRVKHYTIAALAGKNQASLIWQSKKTRGQQAETCCCHSLLHVSLKYKSILLPLNVS